MFKDKHDSELVDIILANELDDPGLADHAFNELYDRYHQRIFKLIHNSINNIDDCMDLFQQTFLNVYKNLNKYNNKYQFSTWIYRIATNIVINHKRHKHLTYKFFKEYRIFNNGIYEPDYVNILYKQKVMTDFHHAIKKIPPKFRLPLLLSKIGKHRSHEIAKILKITSSAVRKRIGKAKELLKNILEDSGNAPECF